MACTTCTRWMVWNESDQNQIFYYYDCNDGTTLLSSLVGAGNFYSVCGCQASGSYASSNDPIVGGLATFIDDQRIEAQQTAIQKSYEFRNELEMFNLDCWALTAESIMDVDEWVWLYQKFGFTGDYEFIFFE